MSVDLSDPAIQAAKESILSHNDSRSWYVAPCKLRNKPAPRLGRECAELNDRVCLGYTDPPNALKVVGLGSDPALPSIRQLIDSTQDDVMFAYAEVKGKGLIIAFMRDSVG